MARTRCGGETGKIIAATAALQHHSLSFSSSSSLSLAAKRQELELVLGMQHVSLNTAKLGSLMDVEKSRDPKGLKTFYYLVQDLKCFALSLINLHFKVKPI